MVQIKRDLSQVWFQHPPSRKFADASDRMILADLRQLCGSVRNRPPSETSLSLGSSRSELKKQALNRYNQRIQPTATS